MSDLNKKKFFSQINFEKKWTEADWEKFFQAQDRYREDFLSHEIRKKPLSRITFEGEDEVAAFEPLVREYGMGVVPAVVRQVQGFKDEGQPPTLDAYLPHNMDDPHYWIEGVPLSSLVIYRDCCRFAITTAKEIERYLKRKDPVYKKEHTAEFESLRFHAYWVAINVAHGHQIGSSEDRIFGNIAKCRRAINHINICISLINRISQKTRSSRLRTELFSFAVQLRSALIDWVDELIAGEEG